MSISSNSQLEGSPHVGRAYDARCGVVLPSHPPQFLAFGERHLPLVVAASNGAFDRHFSGHFPILQRLLEERGGHASRVFSVSFNLGCGVGTIPAPR